MGGVHGSRARGRLSRPVRSAAGAGPTWPAPGRPTSSSTPALATRDAAAAESTPVAVDGGTLQRRLLGEPTSLNAVLQTSLPEAQVLQYVQRNLFDFDAALRLVPGLAASMQVSPDGREYVITLRPEAVWEDGKPVTAADAVFTIRKIADPGIPAPVFQSLYDGLERVEALDTRRFRAVFREAYAFREMAFVMPVLPAHRFEGRDFLKAPDNRAPLSSGPYRVAAWKAGESVELVRNPAYWGPRGHFDRVVLRIVPDNTTAYRMLLAGDLDEDQMDATLKARARVGPAVRRLLPSRRVLHPRLELHRPQQPLAVLRGRARPPGADDALRPGALRPATCTGARRASSRARGRRTRRPTTPRSRRSRSIPPPRRPSSPKRAGATPTGTERWIAAAGSSRSTSRCRRASRRAGRSPRCSPPSWPAPA